VHGGNAVRRRHNKSPNELSAEKSETPTAAMLVRRS